MPLGLRKFGSKKRKIYRNLMERILPGMQVIRAPLTLPNPRVMVGTIFKSMAIGHRTQPIQVLF